MTSQTELLAETQTEKKPQSLIIDFYNLHLESGPKYDKSKVSFPPAFETAGLTYRDDPPYESMADVELVYPNNDEQDRIIEFLEENIPELKDGFGPEWYQGQTGQDWFAGIHFMRLADDYSYTKGLIDEYMDENISANELQWLAARLAGDNCISELVLISNEDGREHHTLFGEDWHNINDYQFGWRWRGLSFSGQDKLPYYGIRLEPMWREIITELCRMLRERREISGCHHDKCNNIFVVRPSGKPQKYCSNSHRVMGYRKRKQMAAAVDDVLGD